MGLFVAVRAASHDRLHVPEPQGRRCRTPLDENQSSAFTPRSPSRKFDGGVVVLERPSVVANIGVNALLVSLTRAASTSVPSLTTSRSGLFSTARRTASSRLSRKVPAGCAVILSRSTWALAFVVISRPNAIASAERRRLLTLTKNLAFIPPPPTQA